MKKTILAFICFIIPIFIYAQEFNVQWLNNMSNYLGKRVRDIPDSYEQDPTNKFIYSREISNGISEGFNVSEKNIINGIIWGKESNSRSFLYSEFDRLLKMLSNQLGDPMVTDETNIMWNWKSKPLVLAIDEGTVGVMLLTPDVIDLTQEQWDEVVEYYSLE